MAGFVEREAPWIGVQAATTSAGWVRLESPGAEQNMNSFGAKTLDITAERRTAS